MAKDRKVGRDSTSGRFVTVERVRKGYADDTGKIGSYSVRRVDSGRFKEAKRAASEKLRERKK